MKKKNISDALNNIDFDMVEDAYENTKQKKKSQKILCTALIYYTATLVFRLPRKTFRPCPYFISIRCSNI